MRTKKLRQLAASGFLLLALLSGAATADVVLQISKSVSRSNARTDGQTFDYTLQYAVVSTTEAGEGVKIDDVLDPNLELVSITGSPHTAATDFSLGVVRYYFVDPLPAGSTGQVSFRARFRSSTPDGYVASNTAVISATNGSSATSNPVFVTAVVPPPPPPPPDPDPDPDPGSGLPHSTDVLLHKDASSKLYLPFDDAYYEIEHGNKGDVGFDIANYVIEDRFPAGIRLHWYRSGRHYGTSLPVDVYYITNTNPSWQAWPGNPRNNTGQDVYVYASEVGLPEGEYVTGLKWDYGTVPGGGAFHPEADGYSDIDIRTYPIDPATLTPGEVLTNCADLTGEVTHEVSQFIRDYGYAGVDRFGWLVLGSGTTLAGSSYTVATDVALGPGSELDFGKDYTDPITADPTATISGAAPAVSEEDLSAAKIAAEGLTAAAAALTPTQSYGVINSSMVINGGETNGYNVINVDSFTLNGGTSLTIDGNPDEYFIFNVSNHLSITGGAVLLLGPSVDPTRILFNILPGATADLSGTSLAFAATLLAPLGEVSIGGGTVMNGTLITGDNSKVFGNGTVRSGGASFETAGGAAIAQQSCDSTQVREQFADMNFSDWDRTNREPYQPGEQLEIGVRVGSDNYNGYDLVNPNINYLLDENFEYVGNVWYSGNAWNNLGQPVPTFQQIDDFAGTGRTLLRWRWDGLTIPAIGSDHDIYLYFKIRVKDDAPIWTALHNEMFGGWQQPQGIGGSWMVTDTLDYDGDGDTTEKVAKTQEYIDTGYDAGGGTASIDSVLWVKGELDTDYTRYPDFAFTTPGGKADYEMRITNTGGTAIKDLTVIDILPSVGDTGVIDLSPRGSEWEPFLAGEVELPNHVLVYYSTAKNPCRPELGMTISGCEDPQWSSTPPSDITTVHSLKFAFGGRWILPGETMTLSWPMRVPVNAPTGGEVAWNSFGYAGKRADNSVALLPSEPFKVGIAALPPTGAQYGDFVWNDEDRDGYFTTGEVGINGVRIELYKDNGDGIQDPGSDTLEDFTVTYFNGVADGYYVFTNLDAGDYYGVVYTPPGMNASEAHIDDTSSLLVNGGFEEFWTSWSADWALAKTNGPHDGVYFVELQWRSSALSGVTQDITGLIENNVAYEVEFFTRLKDADEPMIAEILADGVVVGEYLSPTLPSGWNGTPWNKVRGKIVPSWEGTPTLLELRVRSESTSQRLHFDDVALRPYEPGDDSDGEREIVGGAAVAMFPMTSVSSSESQLNWDQGLYTRAGLPAVWAMAEQDDGKVLLGGKFESSHGQDRNNIVRVDPKGGLDSSFDPGDGANGIVRAIAPLPGGEVLIGGAFTSYDGVGTNGLVCANANGGADMTLPQPNSPDVRSIVSDGADGFYVTGGFSSFGSQSAMNIVRLNSSLAVDLAFDGSRGPDGPVNSVLPMPGGKIIVVGDFSSVDGDARGGVARLYDNGQLDPSFAPTGGANGAVRHAVAKRGGKIILVGDFTEFAGVTVKGTVRLNEDGTVDTTHTNSELAIESVRQGQ